uniref:Uncharacterized protein n=1 Tax=Arundo donax TaxID=35708 RepID=A0A0A9GXM7_ARUDO
MNSGHIKDRSPAIAPSASPPAMPNTAAMIHTRAKVAAPPLPEVATSRMISASELKKNSVPHDT